MHAVLDTPAGAAAGVERRSDTGAMIVEDPPAATGGGREPMQVAVA